MEALPDQVARDFVPPFCPNPACAHHQTPERRRWWRRSGYHDTLAFGQVPRFRCLDCGRDFSTQTFRLDYYAKRIVDYHDLHRRAAESASIRALSRLLGLSCGSVQNRLDRLSRQCLAVHSCLRPLAAHREAVCVDGFQSFDVSRYFPNNITISVTSESRFLLEATHATLRRSGSMTEKQRKRRAMLDKLVTFEYRALERSFGEILDAASDERAPSAARPLILATDKKKEYDTAFALHPLSGAGPRVCRRTKVSSRAKRTRANPLFAVNYFDRELRKDLAEHRRESACHCRNASNGMARFWCYAFHHNYRKRFLIGAQVADERKHSDVAGIPRASCETGQALLYEARAFVTRVGLSSAGLKAWFRLFPTPGKLAPDYFPKYAAA